MTSRGREALAEAARLETARVYGQLLPETRQPAITADELDQVIDRRRAALTVIREQESA